MFCPRLAYAIGRLEFAAKDWGTAYRMFKAAREKNWELDQIQVERGRLDEVFRNITKGN